jgi:protease-4
MSPNGSPFEALQKMLGVSASSARTLAAAAWVFGDPRAERLMDELAQERLRSQGALVLSPERISP